MAADMLNSVLKTESETELNEASAAEQAASLIENAKKQADEKVKAAKAAFEKTECEQLEIANKNSEKALEIAASEAQKYVSGLKKSSEIKLSEAVGLVKDIIKS